MDSAAGGRIHLHPHPENKMWMDVGGFVDMDMAAGGFALMELDKCYEGKGEMMYLESAQNQQNYLTNWRSIASAFQHWRECRVDSL